MPEAAAQDSVRLTGVVQDAGGTPLSGADLTVEGLALPPVRSDGEGRFELSGLPEGEHTVVATLSGYGRVRQTVRFDPERQDAPLVIRLPLAFEEHTTVSADRTGDRDVQSVPAAVSVLPGEALERLQARTLEDASGMAPSLTFSQNTGFALLTIRGIGTNVVFAGSDPSSAVYLDGVYLARPAMQLANLVDLERIEVLRGPQGTLYGRNAVGGAVNLITQRPSNEVEAAAGVTVGSLGTRRAEARVAGPIVRNRLLASAVFVRGLREGAVRDLNHPSRRLGGEDTTVGRAKVQVVFGPRSDLLVWGDVTHQDPVPLTYAKVLAVKPGFVVDNPPGFRDVRASTEALSDTLAAGGAAQFTYRFGETVTLSSLTAMRTLDYSVVADTDITELELAVTDIREVHRQVSQELTVSGRHTHVFWLGGLFLFGDVDRQRSSLRFGAAGLENRLNARVEGDVAAAFGQVRLPVAPRLSATAGLRYAHERKKFANQARLYALGTGVPVPSSGFAYTDSNSQGAWSPRFVLEWAAAETALAYLGATRGFKSGGFNPTSPTAVGGYDPEWAWSYEGGLKLTAARLRAQLNTAVFVTDYRDLQVQTTLRPGVSDISNAAEATITGVEVEGTFHMRRDLQTGGHAAWLDARYDRYIAVGAAGVTGDVAGRRLSNAPEWSGRWWIEWSADLGRAWSSSLRADSRWQSTVYFTPFNDAIQRQRSYGQLDVSAVLLARRWGVSLNAYARNLTNADYVTGTFGSPPPAFGGRPGDPRHGGLEVAVQLP